MSAKTAGRLVGSMLLTAIVVYGGGSLLAASVTGTSVVLSDVIASEDRLTAGVLLMLLNSAIVITIGVAAYPVLQRHHRATATAYLLTRGFEAAMLAVGSVLLLTLVPLADAAATGEQGLAAMARITQEASLIAYWVAMIGLSLGSLLFCRVLLRERLVPRLVAVWGCVGYALLATGGVLELFGHEVGILLGAPGGLFEVTLGVLLVVKGFPEAQHQDSVAASALVPSTRLQTRVSA